MSRELQMGAMDTDRHNFRRREPIRVLHLVSSGGLYGEEQVILNLARSEHVTSYVGALYNSHNPNLDVIDEARRRGLSTVVFRSAGRIDVRTVFQVNRFVAVNGIDILHTHGYKADLIGLLATVLVKTKWVATNHVWHPIGVKMRLYESVDALVLRFARLIVGVSAGVRRDLIAAHITPARIRVIGNGIDIERFAHSTSTAAVKSVLGIPQENLVVTIVGRLSPEKGHQTFFQAAKHISRSHPSVTFLVVGVGPLEQKLRADAGALISSHRVIFAGSRRDMPAIYALSDIVVNASLIEGLPMVVLEAMASKVPVIASRVGGIPDLIEDNETGLLFDPGDAIALARQMQALIDDASKRRRLATGAFNFVAANHSLSRMWDSYWNVYLELLETK